MGSYGNSTFGYKVLVFIFLIIILVLGYIAVTLYLHPTGETITITQVITATPDLPTEVPDEAAIEQVQNGLDNLKALKTIFGDSATYQFSDVDGQAEAKWVPETDSLGPFPANGARAYLTRVYQIGLGEGIITPDRATVFLVSAPSPALTVECQAIIGTAELFFSNEEWTLFSFQPAIQAEESLCRNPQIEAVDFGAGFPGFVFHHTYTEGGDSISVDEFYLNSTGAYMMVFSLETAHQNAAACPPGCFSTFSEVEFVPNEDEMSDLLVTTRGTQPENGVVVVIARQELFRFMDGKYFSLPTSD